MNTFTKVLGSALLFLMPNITAYAQYNTPISHVIIVIQENRTPDNLFQDSTLIGYGANIASTGACGSQQVTLQPTPLITCYDLPHWPTSFQNAYASGRRRYGPSELGSKGSSRVSVTTGAIGFDPGRALMR
jgi:hypothetical protein